MKKDDCIFCKIANGEISHHKVYENDQVLVFLDLNPVNEGHVLIIPKDHYENIYEIPEDMLNNLIKTAKMMSLVIKKTMQADGINVYMNNEKAAGQIIYHAHIHIIPRFLNDGFTYWKGRKTYLEEEFKKTAKKIIQAL